MENELTKETEDSVQKSRLGRDQIVDQALELILEGEGRADDDFARRAYKRAVDEYMEKFSSMDAAAFAEDFANMAGAYVNFFKYKYSFFPEARTRLTLRIASGLNSEDQSLQMVALAALLAVAERQNRAPFDESHQESVKHILANRNDLRFVENFLISIEDQVREHVYGNFDKESSIPMEYETLLFLGMLKNDRFADYEEIRKGRLGYSAEYFGIKLPEMHEIFQNVKRDQSNSK